MYFTLVKCTCNGWILLFNCKNSIVVLSLFLQHSSNTLSSVFKGRERLVQISLYQHLMGWKTRKGYAHWTALWVPRKTMSMERRFLPMKWKSCWKNLCQSRYQSQRIYSHLPAKVATGFREILFTIAAGASYIAAFRASNIICYTSGNCRLLYSLHQDCGNCFSLPSFPFSTLPF